MCEVSLSNCRRHRRDNTRGVTVRSLLKGYLTIGSQTSFIDPLWTDRLDEGIDHLVRIGEEQKARIVCHLLEEIP